MSAALQLVQAEPLVLAGVDRAWQVSGCTCEHGSVYELDLSTEDGSADVFLALDVELDSNPPYLSVWRVKVTGIDRYHGEPMAIEQAVEWVKRNEAAVNKAVLDAHEYASQTRWRWL